MNPKGLDRYRRTLAGLERKDRHRVLLPPMGIDFTSNDYLALANSSRLKSAVADAIERGVPVGAAGSRLLRGNHQEHEALEAEAARYFGTDRCLYFGSGYAANAALFSTLPQRDDLIVYDALVHASVREGIASSKAKSVCVPHNDIDGFADAIRNWRKNGGGGHPWISVESLYSMDGDRAPLSELAELADGNDGFLVIDEAHATGVFGSGGRGFASALEKRENTVVVHTCGKALGVAGALICANAAICDYFVNRARNFIYSTAPSPLMAASVREALRILADEPERSAELERLQRFANAELAAVFGLKGSGSHILPVPIGDNALSVRIAARMRNAGFDLRAIRPPTVPEGTARLRVSITLHVDEPTISQMFGHLAAVLTEERP